MWSLGNQNLPELVLLFTFYYFGTVLVKHDQANKIFQVKKIHKLIFYWRAPLFPVILNLIRNS